MIRATQQGLCTGKGSAFAHSQADLVIIGNGIAGLTTAIETRRLAPEKQIVLITDQQYPTIYTPALKGYASGKLAPEQLLAYPPGTERAHNIHIMHEHVEQIDALSKHVLLKSHRPFGYRNLVIATGSTPRSLPQSVPNRELDGVLVLHRLEDYRKLRRQLADASQAIIIGGGVHAAETAISLRKWGVKVRWLIRSTNFLPRYLDQAASTLILEHMRRLGITIQTETEVVGIIGRLGTVAAVVTNDQQLIPCNLVVCCTGVQPNTGLARRCTIPLTQQNGIVINEYMRTNLPHIYAVGDVAAMKDPDSEEAQPRAQWHAAIAQARRLAAVLSGYEEEIPSIGAYWHATHVGNLALLIVGHPQTPDGQASHLVNRRDGFYRRITFVGDRLIGYLALGPTHPDGLAIKRLIDERISIREILHDLLQPDFDVRAYLAEHEHQRAVFAKAIWLPEQVLA